MLPLGTGKVYVEDEEGKGSFAEVRLYKAGSAQKHAASDDTTLKQALIRALNAPARDKQDQGEGIVRMRINNNLGYLVYRIYPRDLMAVIFHYHWNYKLDDPLTV